MFKGNNYHQNFGLSLVDEEFNLNVEKDIKNYIERRPTNSVLIFPPVNNYHRFLIHKTCEGIAVKHDIVTFSIGQGFDRRTVVCFRQQLLDKSVLKNERQENSNWRIGTFTSSAGATCNYYNSNSDQQPGTTRKHCDKRMGVENGTTIEATSSRASRSNSTGIYRPPAVRNSLPQSTVTTDELIKTTTEKNVQLTRKLVTPQRQRERRPDRAVYVPRGRRSQTTPPPAVSIENNNSPVTTIIATSPPHLQQPDEINKISTDLNNISSTNSGTVIVNNNSSCDKRKTNLLNRNKSVDETLFTNNFNCDFDKPNNQSVETKTKNNLNFENNSINNFDITMSGNNKRNSIGRIRIEDAVNRSLAEKDSDKDENELKRASQEINRSNRRIIKQTFQSDVLEIGVVADDKNKLPERTVNPEEDDWETMFDDNGDCLDKKLMDELTASVGKVQIEQPKTDYTNFQAKQAILNDEEFPHVLEVSNFPVEFKTQDLMQVFAQYKEKGFDIKWVDDTHALAVFSSSRIAAEILAMGHPFVAVKPLAEATSESRNKARKCSGSLQPYRQRPETCAALARRLVTGALGVRLKTAREELENERKVLKEAKERKLLAAKQRQELWEG